MATQSNGTDVTRVAAVSFVDKQFYAVTVDSAGKVALPAAGGPVIGFVQAPVLAGQAATVRVYGKSKAIAGGVIAMGAQVEAAASGKVIEATGGGVNTADTVTGAADPVKGGNVIGIAFLGAGADGDVIEVMITHAGAIPATAV